jgi:DNA-directed RNA polymerase subunit H (RpoH/RPB5)
MKYSTLTYNPTQHIYFNKHEKIKNYEQKHKKYDLKLPILLKTDVACRWYDYKNNDIIKITRKDNRLCYRIVKEDESNNQNKII